MQSRVNASTASWKFLQNVLLLPRAFSLSQRLSYIESLRKNVPSYCLLRKTIDPKLISSLVPHGNAVTQFGRNGSLKVECQHGADECTANTWHACSHLYMSPRVKFQLQCLRVTLFGEFWYQPIFSSLPLLTIALTVSPKFAHGIPSRTVWSTLCAP